MLLTFRAVFSHNLDLADHSLEYHKWVFTAPAVADLGKGPKGMGTPSPPLSYFHHKAYRVKFLTAMICFGQREKLPPLYFKLCISH